MADRNKLKAELLQYYSYLLINKTKRAGFSFLFGFLFVLMVGVISGHLLTAHSSWVYILGPLVFLGIPLILYPPVEQWVYKPWQAKPQKYERHYRD